MTIKVLHIITGLDVGGAEMMLHKLVTTTAQESEVISLTHAGPIAERLRAAGIPVRALRFRWFRAPLDLVRLIRWIRAARPDVVQTWMYHADVIGGVAARLAGKSRLVWNVRATPFNGLSTAVKPLTDLFIRVSAILSGIVPARIICCSDTARRMHEKLGYSARKMIGIPNGFDLQHFRPDGSARRAVCEELGVPLLAPIVGLVARHDFMKGHAFFFKAAAIVARQNPGTHFLLIGKGITGDNTPLAGLIPESIQDRVHLLGLRMDAARLTAAMDVAVSSSVTGEAFPNAVGEAMACGVPCVVTDVGDSAAIVGTTGLVVPPGNAEDLAAGINAILGMDADRKIRLGADARERVAREFALGVIVARYEELYRSMVEES